MDATLVVTSSIPVRRQAARRTTKTSIRSRLSSVAPIRVCAGDRVRPEARGFVRGQMAGNVIDSLR
jgi:hypothetical protein